MRFAKATHGLAIHRERVSDFCCRGVTSSECSERKESLEQLLFCSLHSGLELNGACELLKPPYFPCFEIENVTEWGRHPGAYRPVCSLVLVDRHHGTASIDEPVNIKEERLPVGLNLRKDTGHHLVSAYILPPYGNPSETIHSKSSANSAKNWSQSLFPKVL